MFTLPNRPQKPLEVISNAIKLWRQNLADFSIVTFFAVFFGALPGLLLPEMNTYKFEVTLEFILKNYLHVFLFMLLMLYLFACIFYRTYMIKEGIKGGLTKAFWVALQRLPYLYIALVILNIMLLLGFAMIFFPGFIFGVLLSLYLPIVIIENKGPIQAFKTSWLLVTEEFWHTFMVLFITFISIILLTSLIEFIARDLWVVSHPSGGEIWVGHHMLQMGAGMIFFPIFNSILLVLYFDLKEREKVRAKK